MGAAIVVEDLKRPVLLHVLDGNLFDFSMMTMLDLFDVEDSRNDMSPQMVEVAHQPCTSRVPVHQSYGHLHKHMNTNNEKIKTNTKLDQPILLFIIWQTQVFSGLVLR